MIFFGVKIIFKIDIILKENYAMSNEQTFIKPQQICWNTSEFRKDFFKRIKWEKTHIK